MCVCVCIMHDEVGWVIERREGLRRYVCVCMHACMMICGYEPRGNGEGLRKCACMHACMMICGYGPRGNAETCTCRECAGGERGLEIETQGERERDRERERERERERA